ncbi:MAG: hypothetical protein JNN08_31095 [Bryobacterales bacterium]|nr:hypothetical protein [Bryobacterales bacterium]
MKLQLAIALMLTSLAAAQQSRHKVDINTETPEGQALQAIGQEEDATKKLALLEDFAGKHAQNPNLPWVLGQMHGLYVKGQQHDKVFGVAEKLLAVNGADSEIAYAGLQSAVAKQDNDLIVKWANITNESAKKAVKLPKPEDEDEEPRWKHAVDFGQQVQKRCEYEVYTAALRSTDAGQKLKMMDALKALNPQSEYAAQLDEQYFAAYRATNANDKALEVAEKLAGANKANEDMLLLLANNAFEKKDADNTIKWATATVDLLKTRPAPQGVGPEDWEKKKNTISGIALWMIGMTHASKSNHPQTDAVLRQAVPLIQGNDMLTSHALFQLGLANHRMGEKAGNVKLIQEAYTFFRQCSAVKGPNQGAAAKNATVLRGQYRGLK